MKPYIRKTLNVLLSLLLGGAILYWMYRDFDMQTIRQVMRHDVNWWWMLASFPFGIMAQVFRAWRWKQTLEPIDEHPRTLTCINSIFISYAASLLVPRIGEFTRCGVLARKDGVSFSKALGTVVTERAVDSVIILLITAAVLLMQLPIFMSFFSRTGTRIDDMLSLMQSFSTMGYVVSAICLVSIIAAAMALRKRLQLHDRVRTSLSGLRDGVLSLRGVSNIPLFLFYSVAIWASYFLHYYITFYCFTETASLSITCAMVTFIVGTIAVLVPTPNGAGSWHFAVKTMLILYGVTDTTALFFVLVVHSVQTLLVALLGIAGWICTSLQPSR